MISTSVFCVEMLVVVRGCQYTRYFEKNQGNVNSREIIQNQKNGKWIFTP